MAEPTHITTMTGAKVPLHASVHYVSFSAHADFSETSEFIDIMKPPHVILVHGEQQEMSRLKQALLRNYGTTIQILSPKNCQTVELEFRAQKIAKAVGRIATVRPNDGEIVSGLIVRKDFNYHFMMTEDLNKFTPLISSTVNQKMTVPFTQSWKCLVHFVSQMYDLTEEESKPNLPSAATNSAAAAGSGGSGGSGGTGSGGDVVMKDEKSNDTGSSGSGVALKSESADEKMTPAATASSAAAAAAAAAPAPASAITSAPHFDIPPNTPHIIVWPLPFPLPRNKMALETLTHSLILVGYLSACVDSFVRIGCSQCIDSCVGGMAIQSGIRYVGRFVACAAYVAAGKSTARFRAGDGIRRTSPHPLARFWRCCFCCWY